MRTGIYCRVSTPGQKNTTSLPEQERLCREHAAELGWEVSEPHVYREIEGGEDLYRPQMDRLWESIIRREIDGVVIDVLDRLSRDEGDVGAFFHHADRYGVQVELASEDIDESEHGRTLRTISGIVGRMERADIRRRTQRGRRARAAAGKLFTTGFPLYGYLFADTARTRYIEDPETAPTIRRIFAAVADGMPIRRLGRLLEDDGVPTPAQLLQARGQRAVGKPVSGIWRVGTITRILHHPAYRGEHALYRWQSTAVKERPAQTGVTRKVRRRRERASDDPARVLLPAIACPALVDADVATRALARMAITKAESPGRNPDPLATLWRGMAVCGHCGQRLRTKMVSGASTRKYACQDAQPDPVTGARVPCPGGNFTLSATIIDAAGWADVLAWLSDEENVARLLADWAQKTHSSEQSISTRLDAADAQIATLRNKMNALAESIAETTIRESRRTLQDKLDEYADRLRREEGKREQLLREAREAGEYADAARDVREWMQLVATEAATFTREEQRETLRALGAQITVWRADYVHPDGWPQRYRITLHFTGFSADGTPTTLAPSVAIMTRPT